MANITCEELGQNLNVKLQETLTGVVGSLKTYIDTQDSAIKNELKDAIVKELSDVENLGADLERIQELVATFKEVFDEDNDGTISVEELLKKATLLAQAIEGTNARLDKVEVTIEDYKKELEAEIEELKNRVSALELATAQNTSKIAEVEANVSLNYVSKECVETLMDIKVDEVVAKVNEILFPQDDEDSEGDGNVE